MAASRTHRKEDAKFVLLSILAIIILTCVINFVIVSRLGEPKDTLPNTGIICSEEVSI